ncbi:unnamed protein product [Hymenolepis diminuta]|uniref:Uncharacterized protein n=1 Tax=Hymenolepis diminuta TaxID=6216 RepID=A0A0R3SYM1_HYMDI|nr:unnamed protein product [Hymenolepis diminuta]
MPRRQNSITLLTLRAFQAEPKYKNGEFAYRSSHDRRLQTKRSLMNNFIIVNPDTKSNCFSRFRGMRVRRERLDIFITYIENAAQVRIPNSERSDVEIKLKLPEIECTSIFAFQNKLVFIGGWEIKNNPFHEKSCPDGCLESSCVITSGYDKGHFFLSWGTNRKRNFCLWHRKNVVVSPMVSESTL